MTKCLKGRYYVYYQQLKFRSRLRYWYNWISRIIKNMYVHVWSRYEPPPQKVMMVSDRNANFSGSHHNHASSTFSPGSQLKRITNRQAKKIENFKNNTSKVVFLIEFTVFTGSVECGQLHELINRTRRTAHLSNLCADTVTSQQRNRTWEYWFLGSNSSQNKSHFIVRCYENSGKTVCSQFLAGRY